MNVRDDHLQSGLTNDQLAARRQRMVEQQIAGRGITDRRVLQAMATVPREQFVSDAQQAEAYNDGPLPIGFGQTISQPFTVAFMAQALRLQGSENILEIGTGCGYAAAVLSLLAARVHTIERIPELGEEAMMRLGQLGFDKVSVHTGDGTLGLPQFAPYAGIVAAASASTLPAPFIKQLAPGGTIVLPLGEGVHGQRMARFTRRGDQLEREDLGGFAFVPLIGRFGWSE